MMADTHKFGFIRMPRGASLERIPNTAYLKDDNWDDWGEFETVFSLTVYDADSARHDIGQVKVGQRGLSKQDRRPKVPKSFVRLTSSFFSLGQDSSYYQKLANLPPPLRDAVVSGLRDVVADEALLHGALDERVTKVSLLRSVTIASIRGQFRRVLEGGAVVTPYRFTYTGASAKRGESKALELRFRVKPDANPPTNIHVLIGRNGVGKTRLLNHMSRALVEEGAKPTLVGRFENDDEEEELFANVVSVTFSAFDPFLPLPERKDKSVGVRYAYVGLKRTSNVGGEVGTPKSQEMLSSEFVKSLSVCLQGERRARWDKALHMLRADPIFDEAGVGELSTTEGPNDKEFARAAASKFERLSSGHKVVVLTIARLVEVLEERTLVLLDEPEAHLHPPLLSAFIRALSELLVHRNGVAIVATHSPVVLQEVPSSCVWIMRRAGAQAVVERPAVETFGENIGILTREVFGLEVTHSGFHALLSQAAQTAPTYEDAVIEFRDQLGGEARAILRTLSALRSSNGTIPE